MQKSFSLDLFRYHRIEVCAAETLRHLLSQLIETYIEQGQEAVILLSMTESEFRNLCEAYKDLLIGYKHPRTSSQVYQWRANDSTLKKIYKRFPTCDPLNEKNLS